MNSQREFCLSNIGERFEAHSIVGKRKIADGFAEKDLETNRARLRHWKNVRRIGLNHDSQNSEIDQRLLFG